MKRLLGKKEAAAYCGLSERGFGNWVAKGLVPRALPGTARWDQKALDYALDRLSGLGSTQTEDDPFGTWLAGTMRVCLKGVHAVRAKGRTYYYAWRGGPRISGKPGTPEFVREYHEAHAARRRPPENCLFTLIAEFRQSAEFAGLSGRTKHDYRVFLRVIEDRFGTMPLKALEDPRARGLFKQWRDGYADRPRKADHLWTALSRILSFGMDRGKLTTNVCERGGRLYKASRQDKVWSEEQIASFLKVASPELSLALLLAVWTGQRQGDLLRLQWTAL